MTHAFFKALLFLGAGSVIIAMHHEQDIRKMGGLRKYLPLTYWTMLIGSLALIGFPGFAGFFSKDTIIEAVKHSHIAGAGIAYWAVLLGVFVTALYSFRMYFLVFHGKPRMDDHTREHLHETRWVVTGPLIVLAFFSIVAGYVIDPVEFGDWFNGVIHVAPQHDVLAEIGEHYHGPWSFFVHALQGPAIYLALAGVVTAWYIYMKNPGIAEAASKRFSTIYTLLVNKYYADDINQAVFAGGAVGLGRKLWKIGDAFIIDGLIVNGSARVVGWTAGVVRKVQSGYLYHYAFSMIIGLLLLLFWFVFMSPGAGA
jgi:NADH-quinone oxidoreductase subunit L